MTIIEQITAERKRQDEKWGLQNHSIARWMLILGEEFGEVAKEAYEFTFAKTLHKRAHHKTLMVDELIQTAAVAVAMIECIDRNGIKQI